MLPVVRMIQKSSPSTRTFARCLFCLTTLCLSSIFVLCQSQAASSAPSEDQIPPIGVIDFYGLRSLSAAQARQALEIKEGDEIPPSDDAVHKFQQDAQRRLQALPSVEKARLNFVCCDNGKMILYVGIAVKGAPSLTFRPTPQGKVRLPQEIVKAGADFQAAFAVAVNKGDFAEASLQGYSLFHDPGVRKVQQRFPNLADRYAAILRKVLHHSSDAGERAVAAQIIAYRADRQAAVRDLVQAIHDPDGEVRNNAMRALWLMAGFAQKHPEARLNIPAQPFVEMLNSLDWTDRNKSSLALLAVDGNARPQLLKLLRERTLPSLTDMARWKVHGHSDPACTILGRIGNLPEADIEKECSGTNREAVISAAQKSSETH